MRESYIATLSFLHKGISDVYFKGFDWPMSHMSSKQITLKWQLILSHSWWGSVYCPLVMMNLLRITYQNSYPTGNPRHFNTYNQSGVISKRKIGYNKSTFLVSHFGVKLLFIHLLLLSAHFYCCLAACLQLFPPRHANHILMADHFLNTAVNITWNSGTSKV